MAIRLPVFDGVGLDCALCFALRLSAMKVTLYHNPRCSKSRETLAILQARGIDPVIIKYLEQPPSALELKRIIAALGLSAAQLLRKGQPEYASSGLNEQSDEDTIITAMVECPILIERPIVLVETDQSVQARLGRPPSAVEAILP